MSAFIPLFEQYIADAIGMRELLEQTEELLETDALQAPRIVGIAREAVADGRVDAAFYDEFIEQLKLQEYAAEQSTRIRTSADKDKESDQAADPNSDDTPTALPSTDTPSSSLDSSGWAERLSVSADAPPLQVGDVLKNRFVLEEVLGRGGMGLVFKAKDLRKEEAQDRHPYVAIKVLNESFKQHPESLKALQRESRKSQTLAHPNIVNVFDFDRDGSNVYMTMEYLQGQPLDKLIKAQHANGLEEKKALHLIQQMGQALAYAHEKKIVHSDFKPSNVFLTNEGTIKVFDFGIARATQTENTLHGESTLFDASELGALTPAYASLEMLNGAAPDPRDDIFALACVAYELFTGKHPFDRLPAYKAQLKKLEPKVIKNLSSKQWRGIRKGLAYERKNRTKNVTDFLASLQRKKHSKIALVSVIMGVALLLVLGVKFVPDIIHQRNVENMLARLRSNDDIKIERVLAELNSFDADAKAGVYRQARRDVIGYYERRVERLTDRANQAYDYRQAQTLLQTARLSYPDSARLEAINQRIEARKNQLINELNTRFNDALEQGSLLPVPGTEDITQILSVLEKIDPAHPLLTDPRLDSAYIQAIQSRLDTDDLGTAQKLLEVGGPRVSDASVLQNLADKLKAAIQQKQRETQMQELAAELDSLVLTTTSLDSADALQTLMLALLKLDAQHPAFASAQQHLRTLFKQEVEQAVAQHAWNSLEERFTAFSAVLGVEWADQQQKMIAEKHYRYEQDIQQILVAIKNAVAKRQFSAPLNDNADAYLARLVDEGASASVIRQAQAIIAHGYLARARDARASNNWSGARAFIQQGLDLQAAQNVQQALQVELREIDRAQQLEKRMLAAQEQRNLEKQRSETIESMKRQYDTILSSVPFTIEQARQAKQVLDELAIISPTNAFLAAGSDQLIQAIIARSQALQQQDRLSLAMEYANLAMQIFPGSDILMQHLARLKNAQTEQKLAMREAKIEQYKLEIDKIISIATLLSEPWENKLVHALQKLQALQVQRSAWLQQRLELIADLYLARSDQMARSQRFSEALSYIERGTRLVPDDLRFEIQYKSLITQESLFDQQTAENAKLARLDGLKQTLLMQAKANDIRNAKLSYDALSKQLSEDDPFMLKQAPEALAQAYHNVAEGFAQRTDYGSALTLVEAGLELMPEMVALQQSQHRYQHQQQIMQMRELLEGAPLPSLQRLRAMLAPIQQVAGEQYAALELEFGNILVDRIKRVDAQNPHQAESLLNKARMMFPAHQGLQRLNLSAVPRATSGIPSTVYTAFTVMKGG